MGLRHGTLEARMPQFYLDHPGGGRGASLFTAMCLSFPVYYSGDYAPSQKRALGEEEPVWGGGTLAQGTAGSIPVAGAAGGE